MEDYLPWKTTFGGRQPLVEDDLRGKTTLYEVSYVDKCGAVKWNMGEATILDCPSSTHSQRCVSEITSETVRLLPRLTSLQVFMF